MNETGKQIRSRKRWLRCRALIPRWMRTGLCFSKRAVALETIKRQRAEAALAECKDNFRKLFEEHAAVKTDREHAAAERERLMTAIEQVAEAVVIAGVDGTILYVNPAFEAMSGAPRAEVLGRNVDTLRRDGQSDTFYRILGETLSGGHQWKGRFADKRGDGTSHVVEAAISPVLDSSGRIVNYVSVERDITQHVKMSEQLQHAQRMESIGRLAGGVAHDFNNMLQIILGHVELALETAGAGNPLLRDLKEIQKATQKSADLTLQLLAFARKQTISPRVLDLNATVEGMLAMIKKLIGQTIDLSWRPKDGVWPIHMDPSQIKQILINLSINARDAVQGAGKITIETGTVVFDEAYCARHVGVTCGDFVTLSVSDNGCGICAEAQKHLFEPFFTTKQMGQGNGLGLATVYGIVKQNSGVITVESEPGKGAMFKICFPRHLGAGTAASKARMQPPEHGKGEALLVVEDETAILEMVKKTLERLDYRVFAADTPSKALALADAHADEIQLLITDVVMPDMNGKDLAKQILARIPKVGILFMSGYTANVIAHQGILDEGTHFIQKPFTMADLAKQVRMALETPKA